MKLRRAGSLLDDALDVELAEDWDNPGWNVGQLDDELSGILLCVDPSDDALSRAIESDCNLIVSHHPLMIDAIDSVVDDDPEKRVIMRAINNNVAIYAAHTNVDSMAGGLNDEFVKLLNLKKPEPIVPDEGDETVGLGRVGALREPMTLEAIESELREELELTKLECLGEPDTEVETIAVCTGSGGDFISHPSVRSADLFVTADVKHHDAMDARDRGLNLINLDHYEMESVFLPVVKQRCRQRLDVDVPIETFRRKNPYRRSVSGTP